MAGILTPLGARGRTPSPVGPLTGPRPTHLQHRRDTIRIGISGWRHAPWRGVFYPPGLPQKRELEYAARLFPSIEINGSFYSLQSPASWRELLRIDAPAGLRR